MAVVAIAQGFTLDTSFHYECVLDVKGARMRLTKREAKRLAQLLARWIEGNPETESMWLVKVLVRWDTVEGTVGVVRAFMRQPDDGNIGFCPVFDSREAAEAWADGAEIQEIRAVPA